MISVVIPTYNRPAELAECLGALAKQQFRRDRFEVIVVDDGSAAPLDGIVGRYDGFRWLRQDRNAGPAKARNCGLEAARGDLVAFTDDDCRPVPGWLAALDAAAARSPQAALGGPVRNAIPTRCAEASQLLTDYLIRYFDPAGSGEGFFTSNNLAFPAERLRAIGGFDVSFRLLAGEDRELCDRWARKGNSFASVPDAVVNHHHNLTPRRFIRQHYNYGRGAWHFRKVRERQSGRKVRLEPLLLYAGLLSYPFERQAFFDAVASSGLMLVSQVANAAGFFYQRAQRDWLHAKREYQPFL